MKNLFEEEEESVSTIENLGTVRSIIGAKGRIGFNENNLADPNKALMLVLHTAKGEKQKVFCSVAVSKGIRDKSISAGELMSLLVAPGTTNDGVDIFRVIRPEGNTFFIDGAKVKDKEYKAGTVLVPEDLIAF